MTGPVHYRVQTKAEWDSYVALVEEWAARGSTAAIWRHGMNWSVCVVIGGTAARADPGWRVAYGVVAGKAPIEGLSDTAWNLYATARIMYEGGQGRGYVFTRKMEEGEVEIVKMPKPFDPFERAPRRKRKMEEPKKRRGPLPGHGGRPVGGGTPRLPEPVAAPLPGDPGNPIDLGSSEETEAERAMREADEMMTAPIPPEELPPPRHAGGRPKKARPPPARNPPILTGDPDKDF